MIEIKRYFELSSFQQEEVNRIFFESSARKTFDNEAQRDNFRYKYLDYYKETNSELFLISLRGEDVLGYICGSRNSKKELKLYELLPHYSLFEDLFEQFPAHLHINLCDSSRGLGIGSKLIEEFEALVSTGIHLLTSPKARNRSFYLKNNYLNEYSRSFNNHELLFMGKVLTH